MVGNMYSGTKPINELGGECKHNCLYCSTKWFRFMYPASREKYSGEYRLFEHELKKNHNNEKVIFVCGQNDIFEESVPDEFIRRIMKRSCERNQDILYVFQTKNPARMKDYEDLLPEIYILGTTMETNREEYIKEFSEAPSIKSRMDAMIELQEDGHPIFLTHEPLFDFDLEEFVEIIKKIKPDKVFIGADSKVYKYPKIYNNLVLPEPDAEKILALIEELEKFTVVEQKSNLPRLLGDSQ
ncbi:DUF5131 family protein [candidate division WOR-3 bacterium]|nr:DUF5131 family protein [candidate division WOR-3 bacterium]